MVGRVSHDHPPGIFQPHPTSLRDFSGARSTLPNPLWAVRDQEQGREARDGEQGHAVHEGQQDVPAVRFLQ